MHLMGNLALEEEEDGMDGCEGQSNFTALWED